MIYFIVLCFISSAYFSILVESHGFDFVDESFWKHVFNWIAGGWPELQFCATAPHWSNRIIAGPYIGS